jgi:hypothetical protein
MQNEQCESHYDTDMILFKRCLKCKLMFLRNFEFEI